MEKQNLPFPLEEIHTTKMGQVRIKRNLNLDVVDVVEWCKQKIKDQDVHIKRKGKNWYVTFEDKIITINAHSNTIITAHKRKEMSPNERRQNGINPSQNNFD